MRHAELEEAWPLLCPKLSIYCSIYIPGMVVGTAKEDFRAITTCSLMKILII